MPLLTLLLSFYGETAAACGVATWAKRSTELPLRHLIGLAVADDGQVFVGLHGPNRVQAYRADGQFHFGWFVYSDSNFTMKVEDDHLLLHDLDGRLVSYALDGTLLESQEVPPEFVLVSETADDVVPDSSGAMLSIEQPHLFPRIDRTSADGSVATIIENPWQKWGWLAALPFALMVPVAMAGFVTVCRLGYGPSAEHRPSDSSRSAAV